jgi:hypothetical protein
MLMCSEARVSAPVIALGNIAGSLIHKGTPVRIKDGRIGWVWGYEFATGRTTVILEAYVIRLTLGRGTLLAAPGDVELYRPATIQPQGAA